MKGHIDIETLRFFLCIFDNESLSEAAMQCDLSKPAASRALARLREEFEDELFVRCAGGMTPTPRAKRLYSEIQRLVSQYGRLFQEETFCPSKLRKVFRVACVDNAVATFLAPAIPRILSQAKMVGIQFVPMVRNIAVALRSGEIDFAVYPAGEVQDQDIRSLPLAHDAYVVVLHKNHALLHEKLLNTITMQDLREYPQLQITTVHKDLHDRDYIGVITDVPHETAQTQVWTPYFLSSIFLMENTNLWAVIPGQMFYKMHRFMPDFVVVGREPKLQKLEPHLYWHQHTHSDLAYQWVRSMFVGTSRQLENVRSIRIVADK